MINYRAEIVDSWVRTAPSTRDLATLLGLTPPVTLRDIVNRLHVVETIPLDKAIHTSDGSAINGRVAFELRSDGTSVFSGHMRATGLYSYHYGVQAWATSGDGIIVAAQHTGNVFGFDTPGDRQRNWSQPGINPGIKEHWRSLRSGAGIGYNMHAEIGGVLGGALDVLEFAVKGVIARVVIGPYGWVLLIGNELASMDAQIGAPGPLAGILVAGGILLVVGPYGLVPAIVAGVAVAALVDVKHRALESWERDVADRVFGGQLDYDRIVLTNMTREGNREFTIPSIGNTILVNLGAAFDNPTTFARPDSLYTRPGEVFIHELTHAWQIEHDSIVDLICGLSENYSYFQGNRITDRSWHGRSWDGFNNEQQASIVDDWYGDNQANLDAPTALNDPAFRFIRDHIRTGIN